VIFYALEMARERVNKRIHGGNGNFDFSMISQKKMDIQTIPILVFY